MRQSYVLLCESCVCVYNNQRSEQHSDRGAQPALHRVCLPRPSAVAVGGGQGDEVELDRVGPLNEVGAHLRLGGHRIEGM